ncbi:helix-turn-helix transcriptional regulator [Paracoccus onubensis]|uniref:DNA-binding protein n=1 Tax=Paracoccus onubensis TaxID=1675788 RepID=A0A418SWX3_9RHOB|nr:helix-turn-helix domain-containing protein [Paracoccus onubensis]RJE85456.1 DNA-binding protein [Paracoccus onubensis]
MSNSDDDKLLKRQEVEDRFGISRRFLEIAAVKGGGPAMVKFGRSVRYRCGDVRAWIEQHRRASTSDDRHAG